MWTLGWHALVVCSCAAMVACGDEDPKGDTATPDCVASDEVCDGLDNDCDGEIDEDAASDAVAWFGDADGDGYGIDASVTYACEAPSGYVEEGGDCDDEDPDLNPETWSYADADGDGYGDPTVSVQQCLQPKGFVRDDTDCDDEDPNLNPETWWYADADGDGYGDPTVPVQQCLHPEDYVRDDTDCDDGNASIHPGAAEVHGDTVDQDCDGDLGCDVPWMYQGDLNVDSVHVGEMFCGSYTCVCGDLTLYGNLENLESLACLEQVTGDLTLDGESLEILDLPALVSVGGILRTGWGIPAESLSLPSLRDVGGDLYLDHSTTLASLDLHNLESVGEDLVFAYQRALLGGELPSLLEVGGVLHFWDRPSSGIVSWSFPALEFAGGFSFYDTSGFELSAPCLVELHGNLGFTESAVTLDLPTLELIDGDIDTWNTYEPTLSLPALHTITGQLDLLYAWNMETLDLPSLENVGGNVLLDGLRATEVSLPSLVSTGKLQLLNNNDVAVLALPALETIDGDLLLDDNTALEDISSLHGILNVVDDLTITDNTPLTNADAQALVGAIGTENIGGDVTIEGNEE